MACCSKYVSGIKGNYILNFFCGTEEGDLNKAINVISRSLTGYGLIRQPTKVKENSVPPEVDFELNRDKIVFRSLRVRKTVFGKTNHSQFCFSLGPTYERN